MDLLVEAQQGNRVFRIQFPAGEQVVFRLLSWKDFNQYWELSQKKTLPSDIIEDTIFRQCCLDQICIEQMHEMRAGIIATVVALIMQMSGPAKLDEFNTNMDTARNLVDTLNSQILMVICRAFPAYKPEEIMDMPWSTVLIRLAQAERILMKKTPPELVEPIRMLTPGEQEESKQKPSIDVNELIKDGKQNAALLGQRGQSDSNLTETDLQIGKETTTRQKRMAMARRFGTK